MIGMDEVDKVLEEIVMHALKPEEISERTGVSMPKVGKILDFLIHFGLVERDGEMFRASEEWAALPLGAVQVLP